MEAVVICGAKPGEDEAAGGVFGGEGLVFQECRKVEALAFDEEG